MTSLQKHGFTGCKKPPEQPSKSTASAMRKVAALMRIELRFFSFIETTVRASTGLRIRLRISRGWRDKLRLKPHVFPYLRAAEAALWYGFFGISPHALNKKALWINS
jgi:hypothetical protein